MTPLLPGRAYGLAGLSYAGKRPQKPFCAPKKADCMSLLENGAETLITEKVDFSTKPTFL